MMERSFISDQQTISSINTWEWVNYLWQWLKTRRYCVFDDLIDGLIVFKNSSNIGTLNLSKPKKTIYSSNN